jgi:DNA-binding NarL/FixJ family response regulator
MICKMLGDNRMPKHRILFVDDEPMILEALKRMLKKHASEWELAFVSDPLEARELFKSAPFDVVVSDLKMPNLNGLSLVKELRTYDDDVQTILLTGTADLANAIEAINEADVLRFYTKPCPAARLAEGVKAALAERARRIDSKASAEEQPIARRNIGEAALNRLPVGVIVVDAKTSVIFMNPLGAELISQQDGLSVDHGQILRAASAEDTASLHAMVREVIGQGPAGDAQAVALQRPSMLRPYSIRAELVDGTEGGGDGLLAMLFLTDPEKLPRVSPDLIGRLFGLTASEARLAAEIASGASLDVAAENLGLTISTVRTYLKQIFLKTGTSRQAELVRLVLMSHGTYGHPGANH